MLAEMQTVQGCAVTAPLEAEEVARCAPPGTPGRRTSEHIPEAYQVLRECDTPTRSVHPQSTMKEAQPVRGEVLLFSRTFVLQDAP